jgi:retron-type reverse transcriptase
MSHDLLPQAIKAITTGDKQRGRTLLLEILKTNQDHEQAWLWLTQTDISGQEKIKSLQHVLRLNPKNEIARAGLRQLQAQYRQYLADSQQKSAPE